MLRGIIFLFFWIAVRNVQDCVLYAAKIRQGVTGKYTSHRSDDNELAASGEILVHCQL